MKHILNNLSNEEKNSIREQHTGGKQLNIENFNKLVNNKLGTVKTLVKEEINEYGSVYSQQELEMMRDPEFQKYDRYEPVNKDIKSKIMELIYNSNSSNEEMISILRSIADDMESSRSVRNDVQSRWSK